VGIYHRKFFGYHAPLATSFKFLNNTSLPHMSNDSEIVIEVEAEITEQTPPTSCADYQTFESEFITSFEENQKVTKVKLDKFLWAARFFKTRALAKAAIERGKVFLNNATSKPSVEVSIGDELYIRQGKFEKHVVITGLSTRRRSLDEASELYEETVDFNKPKMNQYNSSRQSITNHPYRRFQGVQQYNPNEQNLFHNRYQEEQYQYAQQQQAKRSSRFLRRAVTKDSVSQYDNIVYRDSEYSDDN
jgi:ribosome-associated heat shock protein Hsp15